MGINNKLIRPFSLFLINNFLKGTHFFGLKRMLMNFSGAHFGANVKLVGPLEIGSVANFTVEEGCWLGKNLKIDGNGAVYLGRNIDIGPQVTFCTGGHEIGNSDRRAGRGETFSQFVGDGCWIGAHSVIVGNTTIGPGCIVAAGSVVVNDSLPNGLLAGVPAVEKKKLP